MKTLAIEIGKKMRNNLGTHRVKRTFEGRKGHRATA